jgi:hypothetical protein
MSKNPIKKRIDAERNIQVFSNFIGPRYFAFKTILLFILLILFASLIPNIFILILSSYIYPLVCTKIFALSESAFLICAYTILVIIILLILAIKWTSASKKTGKIEVLKQAPKKTKTLVVFLSPLQIFKQNTSGSKNPTSTLNNLLSSSEPDSSKKEKITNLIKETKWLMPYLAIKHNIRKLKKVIVVTSSDRNGEQIKKGTTHQFILFKKIFEFLFDKILIEESKKGGIDFENLKIVFDHIESLYQGNEALIDVTGGQKTNSIAAAIATLAMGRKFQYISTSSLDVNTYDIGYFPED